MYFIIVVIIAVVMLSRSIDRYVVTCSDKKLWEEEDQLVIDQINEFRRKYEDPDLEKQLVDGSDEYKEIEKEIAFKSKYYFPTHDMVLMVFMAKHGKVPTEAIVRHISVGTDYEGRKTKANIEKWHNAMLFLDYYNRVLSENGVDGQIYLISTIQEGKWIKDRKGESQYVYEWDTNHICKICTTYGDYVKDVYFSWEFAKHHLLWYKLFGVRHDIVI